MFTFGFNTTRPLSEWLTDWLEDGESIKKEASCFTVLKNIVNVVSAIFPPMGIYTIYSGIAMMNEIKEVGKEKGWDRSHARSFAKRQIARGVGETVGLGCVFLIIDVIATIYNHFHYRSLDRPQVSS